MNHQQALSNEAVSHTQAVISLAALIIALPAIGITTWGVASFVVGTAGLFI